MEKIFGAGVTAEHRQEQSLLDLFYCRHAVLILGITEPGMFTLGSWTQIILHFWSCLKLDTWSHLWSKAAGFCFCFELQKEERMSVLHWALCMGVLAWHSWQFSATRRKWYLILCGHGSSEGSWWSQVPCGILFEILGFQGRWHENTRNTQTVQRSLIIVGRIPLYHQKIVKIQWLPNCGTVSCPLDTVLLYLCKDMQRDRKVRCALHSKESL